VLTVSDNGHGFDLTQLSSNGEGHFGLLSMRERAESFGGKLALHTQPGQGTRVDVWVPTP